MFDVYLEYLTQFHYIGLFFALLLCGIGMPIPEDIIIIIGGYLAYIGQINFLWAWIVLYLGATCGDYILYWIGHKYGQDILSHRRMNRFFTPKRIHAINHYFHRYGNRTLFFARFMVGLRSTIFLSAGAFKISFRKLVLLNGSAAFCSVSFVLFLAYHFGDKLDQVVIWFKRFEHVVLILVLLLAVLFFLKIRQFFKEEPIEKEILSEDLDLTKDEK